MPTPLNQSNTSNMFIDWSFLAKQIDSTNSKRVVEASNKDADLLMQIWSEAERDGKYLKIGKNLGIASGDILRLKTFGLITGGTDKISVTEKGKKIIKIMSLGETNTFMSKAKEKSYKEILAGLDKRNQKGYRIPKFASCTSNNLRFDKNGY